MESKNLYEIKRTIRFLAESTNNQKSIIDYLKKIENKKSSDKKYDLLLNFLNDFDKILNLIDKVFFYKDSGNLKLFFRVKYGFLQNHTKYDFYKIKSVNKIYEFKDLDFIEDFLVNHFKGIREIKNNLNNFLNAKKEKQNRYREIGFYLQKMFGKNILILKDLFDSLVSTNDIQIDKTIEEIRVLLPSFEEKLTELLKEFGPNNGVEIAKGSFNYYTLNKYDKKYFDNQIESLKSEQILKLSNYKLKYLFTLMLKDSNKILDKTYFENIGLLKEDIENMTLQEVYDFLKDFKAKRKSAFNQFVANGYTYDDLIDKEKWDYIYKLSGKEKNEKMSVELFADIGKEDFSDFKRLTDEIKDKGNQKNDILQELGKKNDELEKIIKNKERRKEVLSDNEIKFKEISKIIDNFAQERGKYFNIPNKKIYTENYKYLCEFYKNIALKLGQIKAKILGFEKQKIDSERLKFFAVIIEEGDNKYIALIPKGAENYHKDANNFLNSKVNDLNGNIKVHHFKSLTLRALQKLCFKEEKNTFIGDVEKELQDNSSTKNKKYFKVNKKGFNKLKRFDEFKIYNDKIPKSEQNLDEKLLIEFYKDVLNTESARQVLDINDFGINDVLINDFEALDDFEIELEKYTYIKNTISIDNKTLYDFIKDYGVFLYKINSQDLSIDDEEHRNKKHTEYWFNFWNENKNKSYDIRINPEFSLYYTLANEKLKDKKGKGLLPIPKKLSDFRNRRIENQLTLVTNFSLHSNGKFENLAFLETKDLGENIKKFNEKLERDILQSYSINDLWHYGIDRGINELATLSITKFLSTKNEKGVNNFEFAKIKCFKLKDEYDKILDIKIGEYGNTKYEFKKSDYIKDGYARNFEVVKNISYFLDRKEIFEEITTGIIDLTQAKLIGDKIVLNGDKLTCLKLKELSAKRRIFELFSAGKICKDSELSFYEKVIYLVDKDNNINYIYWFTEEIKRDPRLKEKIQTILKNYLNSLSKFNEFEDIETILKINHLRDAITSNMVGIIHFLMIKEGYFGKISLENLDEYKEQKEQVKNGEKTGDIEKMIDSHFYQSNTDISRRLEWSLYRKFQETGFVPPEIKQSVFLKDNFGVYKFGIIEFVEVAGTSAICPYCNVNFGNKEGLKNHHKEENDCGFLKLSGEYDVFRDEGKINYDKVAAFTISKFCFEGKLSKL